MPRTHCRSHSKRNIVNHQEQARKAKMGREKQEKKSAAQRLRAAVTHFIFFLLTSSPKKGISHRATVPPRNTQRERERPRERDPERERHQITSSERHTIHRYCPSPSRTPQKPGQRDTVATVWSVRYSRKAGIPDTPPSITHTEIQKHRNTQREKEKSAKDSSHTQKCAET